VWLNSTKNQKKKKKMKIRISQVIPPTQNQINAGILGTVNLEIDGDGGNVVVKLNGFTVRKNKTSGERFLSEPSYKVEKNEEARYYNHYKMFPGVKDDDATTSAQRDKMDKLVTEVLRILDAGGTQKPAQPAAQPAAAAASTGKDPWE
jgi:hypothetical protein